MSIERLSGSSSSENGNKKHGGIDGRVGKFIRASVAGIVMTSGVANAGEPPEKSSEIRMEAREEKKPFKSGIVTDEKYGNFKIEVFYSEREGKTIYEVLINGEIRKVLEADLIRNGQLFLKVEGRQGSTEDIMFPQLSSRGVTQMGRYTILDQENGKRVELDMKN